MRRTWITLLLLAGCGEVTPTVSPKLVYQMKEGSKVATPTKSSSTLASNVPTVDANVPERVETASFALG